MVGVCLLLPTTNDKKLIIEWTTTTEPHYHNTSIYSHIENCLYMYVKNRHYKFSHHPYKRKTNPKQYQMHGKEIITSTDVINSMIITDVPHYKTYI